MPDALKIAKYHCNLFRLHDEENWNEFRKNVVSYAVSLGYDKKRVQKASYHVVKAYKYADKAVLAQKKNNSNLEKKCYEKVLREFFFAHNILRAETKSPMYKVGWYEGARHKDHAKVLWNVFMEQNSKFGPQRTYLSLYTAYLIFTKAYPAHNSHNWPRLTEALVEYWTAIAKSYKNGEKLPIEF